MTSPDSNEALGATQPVKPTTLEAQIDGFALGSLIMKADLTLALELANRHGIEVIEVLQRLGVLIAMPEDI